VTVQYLYAILWKLVSFVVYFGQQIYWKQFKWSHCKLLIGRNVAVDYMKSRYEGVDKRQQMKKLPEIIRQPKKIGGEWDM